MKKLLLIPILLVLCSQTHAGDAFTPLINKGNWFVDGSGRLSWYGGLAKKYLSYDVSAELEYFLADRFSLGGGTAVDGGDGTSTYAGIGPSATYFFWQDDQWAASVGAGVTVGLTAASADAVLSAESALRYFLTPSLAIGPGFRLRHVSDGGGSYQRYIFFVSFAKFF
jgi:hypothetical protein